MKQKSMIGIFFVLFVTLLSAQTTYRVNLEFSQSDLIFKKIEDYDLVIMRKASTTSELGEPMLPAYNVGIAIPKGTEVIRIDARSLSSTEIPGTFFIYPVQPPIPVKEMNSNITIKPDLRIYNSNIPYPIDLANLESQSNLAGQQMVHITVYPLQYEPANGKLILHDNLELTVSYRSVGPAEDNSLHYYKFTELQRRIYEDIIKGMVTNPHDVHLNPPVAGPSCFLPPGEYDHVIITSNAFAQCFQPLVDWHIKKGLRDTVVTIEWIYDNYTGPGDTLQVKQFVMDANTNWGTMYFLMGGEEEIVPFAYRHYLTGDPSQNAPSDQYYADFNDDWTDDVFVGRASIDNETQINTFINKVLKYEKDPPLSGYPLEVLLIGMDIEPGYPMEGLKEMISYDIPGYFNVHKVYDSHGGNHKDSVLYYLNLGQNLVNHADHCNQTFMGTGSVNHGWGISNANVDAFTNDDQPSIVVSLGCEPNAMDYSDCIAEHFVIYNPNQAGIAFVGNTRHGIWGGGSAYSGGLDRLWWQGLFTQNEDDLGKALMYSKNNYSVGANMTKKHCQWTFNLLGEPAMPIWTDTPGNMTVTHDPTLPPGPDNFTVQVSDSRGPIEDALVCCWIPSQLPSELYAKAFTNASGQASLNISPTTPGDTMYVTVTKHNFLAYEGYAVVAVVSGPFVMIDSMIYDDGHNGQANPGETIDFGIVAQNVGVETAYDVYGILSESDTYVSMTTDSSWYGTIFVSAKKTSNPYYNFSIANDCPNEHTIEFTLEFHDDNDSVWTSYPWVTVYAPILTYEDYSVPATGIGILYPAQTADLIVTLKNEGGAAAEDVQTTLITSSPHITINDASGNFGIIDPGTSGDNSGDPYNVTVDSLIRYETQIEFSIVVEYGIYLDTLEFILVVGKFIPTDGYYWVHYSGGDPIFAPVFDWFAIDTTQATHVGTSLDFDRNETETVNLPFTFKYYGQDYDQVSICSNGWIAMGEQTSTDYTNTPIPSIDGPSAMIAGIWDDLNPGNPGEPSDVYYYYDETNHRFIVEYFRVEHYSSGYHETFEIILYDPTYYPTPTNDGEIVVQYLVAMQQPDNTVGIENPDQNQGIQYYLNNYYDSLALEITDEFALKYTTHPPTGIEEGEEFSTIPVKTLLSATYPNPFNNSMHVSYQLSKTSKVSLRVYDVSGRLVRNLVEDVYDAGYYQKVWNGKDNIGRQVPVGIYFVQFKTDDYEQVEKSVLLK